MLPIYLDNAATTRPLDGLGALYTRYADDLWQNPSALYGPAVHVRQALENARQDVLTAFGSSQHRCLFNSGGTEGANMAVRFGARRRKGASYVCGGFEHPCVEQSFLALREGGEDVRFAASTKSGHTTVESVLEQVDSATVLVSVMHVNNETGALNDVEAIAMAVKAKAPHAVFHVDGVQAFLRVPLRDFSNIDYYTVSAHKVHALKGTGALFYKPSSPLHEMLRGGGQEGGLRSGTENVLGALALAKASYELTDRETAVRDALEAARAAFLDVIAAEDGIELVCPDQFAPHILSLRVKGTRGETLMHALEADEVYISTGSACSSKKGKSRAAKALGISQQAAQEMVRVSFSPFTTTEEAHHAAQRLVSHAKELRAYQRS